MGQGGHVVISNGTSFDWELDEKWTYQMNSWNFPETIKSGTVIKVYVEWDQGIFTTESDDQGKASYHVNGKKFLIHATNKHGFNIKVEYLDTFSTYCNPDNKFNLGWSHDGEVLFMLSGNDECRYWDNRGTAKNIMYDSRNVIGRKTLKDICIIGSHDSGMFVSESQTAGALNCNTITQKFNIENQLNYGVRYFDVRPIIGGGKFYTGHYSKIEEMGIVTWQGARGQSIEDTIHNINSFFDENRNEAVILNLSHAYNTDKGNDSYTEFSNSEWMSLIEMMEKYINKLYKDIENPFNVTLDNLLFKENKSSVIVIVPKNVASKNTLPPGFISMSMYDEYSKTNDFDTMKTNQLEKMKNHSKSNYFYLAWTLTQDTTQTLTCGIGSASILDLASKANNGLIDAVMNTTSKNTFPNVISLDNITNCTPALLSYGINMKI